MLLSSAHLGEWAAMSLIAMSKLVGNPEEQTNLLSEALDYCKKAKPNAQFTQATRIALESEDDLIRWQALELMCENFQQERTAILSSIKTIAPVIFAVGNSELTLDVMDAVRETGAWWP